MNLNTVYLAGNVTRDIEIRYGPSGNPVTEIGIAVNKTWFTKDGEEKKSVLFVDVTVWDRQAETCAQYLRKGSGVHVEGELQEDSWDDKATGEKRRKLKVLARRVQFTDKPQGGEQAPQAERPAAAAPSRPLAPAARPSAPVGRPAAPSRPAGRPTPPPPPGDDDDSNIPF